VKVDLLRLQLPPWTGPDDPTLAVRCGWRGSDGAWRDGGTLALGDVAGRFRSRRYEACLHPGDLPMAGFTLPPLSGRRLRAAVLGAVEPCALQPLESLVVGFGPREADGTVGAAWLGAHAMDGWTRLLRRSGIAVRGLCPPTAFLPFAAQGWVGCRIDGWCIVRTGRSQGFTHWMPQGADHAASLAAQGAPASIRWLDIEEADAAARWSGEGWRWSLPAAEAAGASGGAALAGPALGWGAIAAAVWLGGLNVYAGQLATQGQALKRQMAARVKAAFPDLPLVVNPVQQARQQKEALAAGGPQAAGSGYAGLAQGAVRLLAEVPAGQVQSLRYAPEELRIRWRDGGAPSSEAWGTLQARAREQGLAVESDAGVLRVRMAAGSAVADAAAPDPQRKDPP
jgi:general secretion pathway protein L